MEVQALREQRIYYSDLIQAVRIISEMKRAKRGGDAFVPASSFFRIRHSFANASNRVIVAQRTVSLRSSIGEINSVQTPNYSNSNIPRHLIRGVVVGKEAMDETEREPGE